MPTKSHGYTGTRLYNTWLNIKQRCHNRKNPRFKDYGGRGIIVCKEWISSFVSFKNWAISNGYSDNLTIDRIDNNFGYEPDNCRWITNAEQQLNRGNNRILTYNGKTQTITEWAREYHLRVKTLEGRLNDGWGIEKALTTSLIEKRLDLKGERFGLLVVLSFAYINKSSYWVCKCDCGKEKIIKGGSLTEGATRSCGCLQRKSISTIAKNRDYSKPIIQFNMRGHSIREFNSPKEASELTGISKANIVSVANRSEYKPGKIRKHAGGFIWKYK